MALLPRGVSLVTTFASSLGLPQISSTRFPVLMCRFMQPSVAIESKLPMLEFGFVQKPVISKRAHA